MMWVMRIASTHHRHRALGPGEGLGSSEPAQCPVMEFEVRARWNIVGEKFR